MTMRTARKGDRAGLQFWGCTRYPTCRGIVNVDAVGSSEQLAAPSTSGFRRRQSWTDFGLRGPWTAIYAPAGARLRSWDPLGRSRGSPALVRAASQAVFFRANSSAAGPYEMGPIDTLRRVLTRGDRPPVDPLVESWVLEAAGLGDSIVASRDRGDLAVRLGGANEVPGLEVLSRALTWRESFELDPLARTLDGQPVIASPIESEFLDRILRLAGTEIGHWIIPQAGLGPILGNSQDSRRVDFLIAHPAERPIVAELDGAQHRQQEAVDADRDRALRDAQIDVERFGRSDLQGNIAGRLRRFEAITFDQRPASAELVLAWGPIVAHRVARGVVEGIAAGDLSGKTWRVRVDEPIGLAVIAMKSIAEMIGAVADVWGLDVAPDELFVQSGNEWHRLRRESVAAYAVDSVTSTDERLDFHIVVEPFHGPWHRLPDPGKTPTMVVRSASIPIDLREGRLEGGRRQVVTDPNRIDRGSLERLLQAIFAKREFYPAEADHPRGQEIAIRRLLGGRDAVVLLPTGAGKSLIYQLAGLILPGRTLVIDPIVALIDDQLDGLARQGVDRAVGITSADTAAGRTEAKLAAIQAGDALFCFVAPERLQQRAFRDAIRALSVASAINLCVVDEAHCVSEWGHDFRTSYLDIGRVLRDVASDTRGIAPPLLALTGTASRSVLRDLMIELDIDRSDPDTIVAPKDFDRPELRFDIVRGREDETVTRLLGTLRSLPATFRVPEAAFFSPNGPDTFCGVVFTQTVNPSKAIPDGGVLNLQAMISRETAAPVGIYAGSRPKAWQGTGWDQAKRHAAAAFKDNELSILVSTKAYGMGIDKPNIRYIVHVGVPGSIEAYYQEVGRAGRDRQRAQCVIVHDRGGRGFHDFLQERNYRGPEADLEDVRTMLNVIGAVGERRTVSVPKAFDEDGAENQERAIHRLKMLGVVEDYLVDWGGSKFDLRLHEVETESVDRHFLDFVRRTLPGRVPQFEVQLERASSRDLRARILADADLLIRFVYETVVNARRRALEEMVSLADDAREDAEIRDRILRYLELGRVAGELEALVDVSPFDFGQWQILFQQLDTVDDGREWRGSTARFLESAPDHPGLLVGRALAEAIVPGGDVNAYLSNLEAALRSATEKYLVDHAGVASFGEWLVAWVHERRRAWSALTLLVMERALGTLHLESFSNFERKVLSDRRAIPPDETAVVLARRTDRHRLVLAALAAHAQELN